MQITDWIDNYRPTLKQLDFYGYVLELHAGPLILSKDERIPDIPNRGIR